LSITPILTITVSEGGGDTRARSQPDERHYYQDGDVPYFLINAVPGVRTIGPVGPFSNEHYVKLNANLLNVAVNTWTQLPVREVFNAWSRNQRHTLSEGTKVFIRRSAYWETSKEDDIKAEHADPRTLHWLPSTISIVADTHIPYLRSHECTLLDTAADQRGEVRARAAFARDDRRLTRQCTGLCPEPEPSPVEIIKKYHALHLLSVAAEA